MGKSNPQTRRVLKTLRVSVQKLSLLLLAGLLLGCGNRTSEATPTPAPTTASTPTSAGALIIIPTATPTRAVPLLADVAVEPVGVASYRTAMSFTFTAVAADDTPINAQISSTGARIFDPPAASLTFHVEGMPAAETLDFTVTTVADSIYTELPDGQCLVSTGDADNPFTALMSADLMLENLPGASLQGEEVLNGRTALVYAFDESTLDPNDPTSALFQDISGQLFVDKEDSFVLRIVVTGTGNSGLLNLETETVGKIEYELTFYDFNQSEAIVAPPGCGE